MVQSTFDQCLLISNGKENAFGVVGLQTDYTLFLANGKFAAKEEDQLNKAGFLAKEREKLSHSNSLKFNGGCISLDKEKLILFTQQQQCLNLRPVKFNPTDVVSSRGEMS